MAELAYIEVLEKFTNERIEYEFEFSGYISDAATIGSAVTYAYDEDGTDVSSTVILDTLEDTDGTTVTVTIDTLSSQATYTIVVQVTDSNDRTAKQVLLLNVTVPGDY